MSEIQEKVWVVMKSEKNDRHLTLTDKPVKVFDDRADARKYVGQRNVQPRSRYIYTIHGVKKG